MFGRYYAMALAVTTAAVATAVLLAGCGGGGDKTATTGTGSSDGSLYDVQISPAPGTTFISSSTVFTLSWTADNPPPPSFTAGLERYEENCNSDGGTCIDTQRTVLTQVGNSYEWQVSRKDGFTLDKGGVYYLQLDAGSEEVLAAYIVSSDGRAQMLRQTTAQPAVKDAGAAGALRHLVVTR